MVLPDEHCGGIFYLSKNNNNVEKLLCSFNFRNFWAGSLSQTLAFDTSTFHAKHCIVKTSHSFNFSKAIMVIIISFTV